MHTLLETEPTTLDALRPLRSIRRRLSCLGPISLALLVSLGSFTLPGCASGDEAGAETAETGDGESEDEESSGEGNSASSDAASGEDGEAEDDKPEVKEKTTFVYAAEVTLGNLVIPVTAEGRIRARKVAEISTEIAGGVERIFIEEGDRVGRGQILARLDGREYEVAIAEARSRYLESLSRILIEEDGTREEIEVSGDFETRLQELWTQEQNGRISREERLRREREIEIEALQKGAFRQTLIDARTGLAAAKADEERARLNLERTQIRAPFAGVVSELELQPGERVGVGEKVCVLVDNTEVEAEVGVLESDLRGLEVGRAALLAVPALGETLQAKVDVISPSIDPDTRTCPVLLRYQSDDGRVRPGMFVRALIAGQTFEDRVLVPRAAILMRDDRPLVFKIEDGRAKWVYVTTGMRNDNVVEIANVIQGGPLDPGTKVVVSDHLTLTENAKVKVRETRGLGDPWALANKED